MGVGVITPPSPLRVERYGGDTPIPWGIPKTLFTQTLG